MIKFKFENQDILMPTSWEEVTVAHFINEGFLSGNPLKLMSVLSGISVKQLANTTIDLTDKFEKGVKFLKEDPNGWKGNGEVPSSLKLLEVECKIPINIEMKMLGQKIMLEQELAKHKYFYSAMPEAIAIYLGPQIYPDDWYEKIPEIAEAVNLLPIFEVYNIADFFLTNTEPLHKNGITF